MNIGDEVLVNVVANNIDTPNWKQGTIESIYIAYKTNYYMIRFQDGTSQTYDESFIKELDNGTNSQN